MYFTKFLIFSFAILSIINLSQQCIIKIENETKFDLKQIGSILNPINWNLPDILRSGETKEASIDLNLIDSLKAAYLVGDTGTKLNISNKDLFDSLKVLLLNILNPINLIDLAREILEIEASCNYRLSVVELEDGKVTIQAKINNEPQ